MAEFTNAEWETLIANLVLVLGADAYAYSDKKVAKLAAAIPYLAGSEDPDRFALSNLLTLHAAAKARKIFDHRLSDDADLYRRLASFNCGAQADTGKLRYGMDLLAIVMIEDHKRDAEADKRSGKYNPLNSGAWDAESLESKLYGELNADKESAALYEPVFPVSRAAGEWWLQ